MSRRIRTQCPRCGMKVDAPDLAAELKETKRQLQALRFSVASTMAKAAKLERKRVEKIIKTARTGNHE